MEQFPGHNEKKETGLIDKHKEYMKVAGKFLQDSGLAVLSTSVVYFALQYYATEIANFPDGGTATLIVSSGFFGTQIAQAVSKAIKQVKKIN